ncbi:MAG: AAA family ATPase [Mycobacteriales bacterium]
MTEPVPAPGSKLDSLIGATGGGVLRMAGADVGAARETRRRSRWVKLTAVVWLAVAALWLRAVTYDGAGFVPLPSIDPFLLTIIVFFGLLIGLAVGQQVLSGRSPHVVYRPEQISTRLADVVGIDGVKDDVVRSLNLFLAHQTFRDEMGGTPRRGLLFEGAPGTGKTHLARAMAREAGVPFLFVSATSFQSMWYGASAKKIRSYFKALRKAARKEGGAIGFIEEIDAIAMSRGGVSAGMTARSGLRALASCPATSCLPPAYTGVAYAGAGGASGPGLQTHAMMSEGTGGVVNELLVQL